MKTKEQRLNEIVHLHEDSPFAAALFSEFPLWRTQEVTITDLCRFKEQHEPKNGWDTGPDDEFNRWNLTFNRMWVIIRTFRFIHAMEANE